MEQQDGPIKVMVYGTLKRGYGNHDTHLKGAKFLGECGSIRGVMFHLGGIPAIYLGESRGPIWGEVFEVSAEQLASMDRLEGIPDFYNRVRVQTTTYGLVWTYVFEKKAIQNRGVLWVVPTGMWNGPTTPKRMWSGFDKDNDMPQKQELTRVEPKKTYRRVTAGVGLINIIDNDTGEVYPGGPFKCNREIIGKDGVIKPVIIVDGNKLPSPSRNIHPTIKGMMERTHADTADRNLPVVHNHAPYGPPYQPVCVPPPKPEVKPFFSHTGPGAEVA